MRKASWNYFVLSYCFSKEGCALWAMLKKKKKFMFLHIMWVEEQSCFQESSRRTLPFLDTSISMHPHFLPGNETLCYNGTILQKNHSLWDPTVWSNLCLSWDWNNRHIYSWVTSIHRGQLYNGIMCPVNIHVSTLQRTFLYKFDFLTDDLNSLSHWYIYPAVLTFKLPLH